MKNPLRESGVGKGSKPRSCHNPKFRKNFDKINWIKEEYKIMRIEMIDLSKRKKKK